MKFKVGYTNAGNTAVLGGGKKLVLVTRTGEFVYHASFPEHILEKEIEADSAEAAAWMASPLDESDRPGDSIGEAKAWDLQRTQDKSRNLMHEFFFIEHFTEAAEAMSIGQLKARFTAKQFAGILRSAREGYSCHSVGGDPFFKEALLKKLKAAVQEKRDRRMRWQHRQEKLHPRGYVANPWRRHKDPLQFYKDKLESIRRARAAKKAAALAKRRAPLERLAVHIARHYQPPGLSMQFREPRYGYATASESAKGRSGFYTVAHARPGVTWEKDGLYYHPVRGAKRRKIGPRIQRELKKRIDLDAFHPVGLFATRMDGSECVACYDSPKDKKSWDVVGYAFRGHLVPESVVTRTVSLPEIEAATNDELKRILIEHYGTERYLQHIGAQPVQQDDWGALYDLGSYRIVRMVNSTIEPDGTAREYFRAVPKSCATAKAAIAWTYNLTEEEYFAALTATEAAAWMS